VDVAVLSENSSRNEGRDRVSKRLLKVGPEPTPLLGTPAFESVTPAPEVETAAGVASKPPLRLARALAQESQNRPFDAALARVVSAWPTLPEAIRKAMLTLAESGE
jgi:hypothetical protein